MMTEPIRPAFLKPGDTVAVVAPASWQAYAELEEGLRILRDKWHLNVLEGRTLHEADGPFAGPDSVRLTDVQGYLDNPDVRAIFTSRGGYGCYRIADWLDFSAFRRSPKWLIGFSDVTVLLSLCARQNIVSLHGPMIRQFGPVSRDPSIEMLRQVLFGEKPLAYTLPAHPLNRCGEGLGLLVGGNLTLLTTSIETPTDLNLNGCILFIEDIDETLYSLDRMMQQLRRSGRLANLAGLVVGQFTDMRQNASLPFGKDANQIIADAVASYTYPVLFDFPAGHIDRNMPLLIGAQAALHVADNEAMLQF